MKEGRRSRTIEIMNFCERNHFPYNLTWTIQRQYEIIFMFAEHQYAVEAFLKKLEKEQK